MKPVIAALLCFGGLLTFSATYAQNKEVKLYKEELEKRMPEEKQTPTDYTKRKDLQIMNVGYTNFNKEDLGRMPTRDLNKIVNTVQGVNSSGNEAPRIRGAAPSGTAYFVDGVRVYGALPNGALK